jgi:4-amino-4-deoxy-L-arabinose transferase-like glycosyltransferase
MRAAAAILLLSCAVNLATLDGGHDWGDDFAGYVRHAANLAQGRPYGSTSWIPDAEGEIAPAEYPPGFPLLLAPVFAVTGLNFRALKVLPALSLTIALLLLARIFAREIGPWALVCWAALCAAHHYFVLLKNMVLSDFPFLMLCAAALLAMERSADADARPAVARRWGVAAGAAIGAAIATRTLGLVLLPALVTFEVLRFRRLRPAAGAALCVAFPLVLLQFWVAPGQMDYLAFQMPPLRVRVFRLAQLYAAACAGLLPGIGQPHGEQLLGSIRQALGAPDVPWLPPRIGGAEIAAFFLMAAVVQAFVSRVRKRPGPVEVFTLLYLVQVILAPVITNERYLVPVLPMLWYYLVRAAAALPIPSRRWMVGLMGAATACAAGLEIEATRARAPVAGIEAPDARAMFEFIRKEVPPEGIVAFAKPRALALMTERRTAGTPFAADPVVLAYLDRIKATHVAAGATGDPYTLSEVAERNPAQFERVFTSGSFVVFQRRATRPGG